ncbi:hypothetical protein PTKIN_Ptkin07bG0038000 [Pterospermum kingtungense]
MEWELRSFQMEEIEKVRTEGSKKGKRFGVLDVTRAMLVRPDGHPAEFWGNKWMQALMTVFIGACRVRSMYGMIF